MDRGQLRLENRPSILRRVRKIKVIKTLERVNDLIVTGKYVLLAITLKWGGSKAPCVTGYHVGELGKGL
jgi:hypothetical protein